jgi:hypothetical protein
MKASTVVTKRPHIVSAVSAIERPNITDARGIGSERRRSCRPVAASSATPVAAGIPNHRMPVARKPGTRKSTYSSPPPGLMAPPKM